MTRKRNSPKTSPFPFLSFKRKIRSTPHRGVLPSKSKTKNYVLENIKLQLSFFTYSGSAMIIMINPLYCVQYQIQQKYNLYFSSSVLTLNPRQSLRNHRRQPPPANPPCSTQELPRPNENWKRNLGKNQEEKMIFFSQNF